MPTTCEQGVNNDKRELERLVRCTVHAFVFRDEDDVPPHVLVASVEPLVSRVLRPSEPVEADSADSYVRHCERVLECRHWATGELERERMALKTLLPRCLDTQKTRATVDTSETSEDIRAFEAYALLKLFLLERSLATGAQLCPLDDSERHLCSLHVQLELYRQYFERSRRRMVRPY